MPGIAGRARRRRMNWGLWKVVGVAALLAAGVGCTKKRSEPSWVDAMKAETKVEGRAQNLILVTIDTLRADALGAYGGEWKTPNLDAFAEQSLVFEKAFATAPFTGPSHASILTSRHPSKHGVIFNGHRVSGKTSPDSVFISEHLAAQGFATAAIISSPSPTRKRYGFGRGFDAFVENCPAAHGEQASDGQCLVDKTRAWLEKRPKDERFFVWLHTFDPHFPYTGPAEMYERQGLDPEEWIVTRKKELPKMSDERVRKAYLADVYEADHYFGELMAALADLGLLDSTVIAVTSDHGEYLGEHGRYGHSLLYDEVLHVPFLIFSPGAKPGRRPELVSTIDLAPTALELLGVPSMPSAQGRSVLKPGADETAPPVYAEWRHFRVVTAKDSAKTGDFQLGVRTQREKLIVDWLFPKDGSMLFDLDRDPDELENRFLSHPDEVAPLNETLQQHTKSDLDPQHLERSGIEIDAQTMEMLQALGYVE